MSLYTGQRIAIEIACTLDGEQMAGASSAVIAYRTPSGTVGQWAATVDNIDGKITVTAEAVDISEAGTWAIQPVVTFPVLGAIPGTSTPMPILGRFS